MDGLLLVDKPVGPTSHDVVARIRRLIGERRIGHTGTLDPAASGVLPLVIGRATRLARFLSASDKTYEAVVRLGVPTDTYDAAGTPVGPAWTGPMPGLEDIERALDAFRGTFAQQPPAYSAKKIAGTRSYKLARMAYRPDAGQLLSTGAGAPPTARTDADASPRLPWPRLGMAAGAFSTGAGAPPPARSNDDASLRLSRPSLGMAAGAADVSGLPTPPRLPAPVTVTAHSIQILSAVGDLVSLRVDCSAGFYVRSLAHDLGERLGTGAHLAALRRTRSGEMTLADAVPLELLEEAAHGRDAAMAAIVPLERMLPALPSLRLTDEGAQRAGHGRDLRPSDFVGPPDALRPARVRLFDPGGDLVGVAEPAGTPGLLHPCVVLV